MTWDQLADAAEERFLADLAQVHPLPLGCGRPLYADPGQACGCRCSHCGCQVAACGCHCDLCTGSLHTGCQCPRPVLVTGPGPDRS